MKRSIRYISLFAAMTILTAMTGCSGESAPDNTVRPLRIVTTIFPEYDWVKTITEKSGAEVSILQNNGTDMHSYKLTAEDIIRINECDVFIYVGGESDESIKDVLATAPKTGRAEIKLMDVLKDRVRDEELTEGMVSTEEEEPASDEHVWLSLTNAVLCSDKITEVLSDKDPGNAKLYQANHDDYVKKLKKTDEDFKEVLKSASSDTVVFGDRFPFRYLFDDYSIKYYAPFSGCSAETEASFETISFMADKLDECSSEYIAVLKGGNSKLAKTISESSKSKKAELIELDPMQQVTQEEIDSGVRYIDIMKDDLSVLAKILGVIDTDLTELSSGMVYATVFDIVSQPDSYIGKNVRMEGIYNEFTDPESNITHKGCIVQDATQCCAQGIEFITDDDTGIAPEQKITVVGRFGKYDNNGVPYYALLNAKVTSSSSSS